MICPQCPQTKSSVPFPDILRSVLRIERFNVVTGPIGIIAIVAILSPDMVACSIDMVACSILIPQKYGSIKCTVAGDGKGMPIWKASPSHGGQGKLSFVARHRRTHSHCRILDLRFRCLWLPVGTWGSVPIVVT